MVRGYRVVEGEVDLVARDGPVLVFVEVKTRRKGEPAEAVGAEKQRRLVRAALHFQRRHGLLEAPCRFDVVAIVWPEDGGSPRVEHIVDAFSPAGRGQLFA